MVQILHRFRTAIYSLMGIVLFFTQASAETKDCTNSHSIEETITHETALIFNARDAASLSDAYLSRGESYIICEQYLLALEDLDKGYEAAQLISDDNSKFCSLLRALFAKAIACANLDMLEDMEVCTATMHNLLNACYCSRCYKISSSKTAGLSNCHASRSLNNTILVTNDEIIGEDHISITECIERTRNTARLARALILKAKLSVQFTLTLTIDHLEDYAYSCCRAGGVWKACLQPLVSKWLQWHRKWEALRLPPDPAWDD